LVFIWEGIALALACSADAFAAGFAYGSRGIHIPVKSGVLIALICTAVLSGSLWLGGVAGKFIPEGLTGIVCFAVLAALGIAKLIEGFVRRKPAGSDADKNNDMTISPAEAAVLAIAISLDGLAVGFGAGVGKASITATTVAGMIIGTAAVLGGARLGERFSRTVKFNMPWISGVILIGLAVWRLYN
jgi:putative Mn2+ efflux pump MntP